MEQVENNYNDEHVINIRSSTDVSSSGLSHGMNALDPMLWENRPAAGVRVPVFEPSHSSVNGSSPRNSSLIGRGDGRSRHQRSPLSSGLWISVELILTLGQIIASIVVLSLSRHEHSRTPLFAWIVGYASGCIATLPLLYWRFSHLNNSDHGSYQTQESSPTNNHSAMSTSSSSHSITRASEGENRQSAISATRGSLGVGLVSSRLKSFMEYFKMGLDCFFAVWFVVGNVWIFGGHSSSSEASKLYWLCLVFLTFSCIGYAMPFILCATICCCIPCIVSVLGFREDLTQSRGATMESINSLPTYKFKVKKNKNSNGREVSSGPAEAGVIAAGTEKERSISGEDAVCCICLAKYAHNDELRELPCSHLFHKECVDKWLKINALCPLCKAEVGEKVLEAISGVAASL